MLWKRKYDDAELITAIKAGGMSADKAVTFIYSEYRNQVLQFIISKNGTKNEALDIFQDAVVQLVSGLEQDKFRGNSSIKTYLFAISKRLWYRRFNKNTRHQEWIKDNPFEDLADEDPEEIMLKKDLSSKVEELMSRLPQKSRQVLLLWVRNYSMREIAEKMGFKNEQVARNKKSNSLKELKQLVNTQEQIASILEELK